MRPKLSAVILVLCLTCCNAVNFSPPLKKLTLKELTAVDLLRHGQALATEVYRSWDETPVETADRTLVEHAEEAELVARIVDLGLRIRLLDETVRSYAERTIGVLLRELPSRLRLELRLDALSDMVTKVNVASDQLQRYLEYNSGRADEAAWRLERHTVQELAEWAVSHQPDSVLSLLERIHSAIVPTQGDPLGRGILGPLADVIGESGSSLCDVHQSPQQLLYNIYSSVVLTDLRGYAMLQFSWMMLRHYNKGNFTVEARLMRDRFEERSARKTEAIRTAMASASRDLYRCDPVEYVEGRTYQQLTRLLQGQLDNEVDINRWGGCWQNCAYYERTQSYGCYMDQYCARQPACEGTLHDCTFYDSDMWICQDESAGRRYDWIEYEDGTVLGQKGPCLNGTAKADSWWRWLFWHCSYCLCLCDQQGPDSDRYFSLRPSLADVRNNSVVTGLRLVKLNRVIHLQIREGSLLPRGGVNISTLRWRPVDGHSTPDDGPVLTLTYDRRAVDLDDLVAPPGRVLTGVRFNTRGDHLTLEITSARLDYDAGVLVDTSEGNAWIAGNDATKRLDLPSPDVPTHSPLPHHPDSLPGQFLLFSASDTRSDAAQSTVPFLDAQPVSPHPPTLLSGAGLYHRGRAGSGGFVAPRLVTYDYSPHL